MPEFYLCALLIHVLHCFQNAPGEPAETSLPQTGGSETDNVVVVSITHEKLDELSMNNNCF